MSKRVVHDCDRCGAEGVVGLQTLDLVVGSEAVADGNRTVQQKVHEVVDICPGCLGALLRVDLGAQTDGMRAAFVYRIRMHQKRTERLAPSVAKDADGDPFASTHSVVSD